MNVMLQMRPKPEAIVQQGVVELEDLMQVYEVKDDSDNDETVMDESNLNQDSVLTKKEEPLAKHNDFFKKEIPWEISLTKSLLFLTVREALKQSMKQTENVEKEIHAASFQILEHVNKIRDTIDQLGTQNVVMIIVVVFFFFKKISYVYYYYFFLHISKGICYK
ncbi:hypothetical protein RFI_12472, partial [Reticulomyxa filosa]